MNLLTKRETAKKYTISLSTVNGWVRRRQVHIKDNHIIEDELLESKIAVNHKLRNVEFEEVDITGDYFDASEDCTGIMANYHGGSIQISERDCDWDYYFPGDTGSHKRGKS